MEHRGSNRTYPDPSLDPSFMWNEQSGGMRSLERGLVKQLALTDPLLIRGVHLQGLADLDDISFRQCFNLQSVTIVSDGNRDSQLEAYPCNKNQASWRQRFPDHVINQFVLCLVDCSLDWDNGLATGDLEHFADLVTSVEITYRWYWLPYLKLTEPRPANYGPPTFPRLVNLTLRGLTVRNCCAMLRLFPALESLDMEDVWLPNEQERRRFFMTLNSRGVRVKFTVNRDFPDRHNEVLARAGEVSRRVLDLDYLLDKVAGEVHEYMEQAQVVLRDTRSHALAAAALALFGQSQTTCQVAWFDENREGGTDDVSEKFQ
jgi:hypothetical protein